MIIGNETKMGESHLVSKSKFVCIRSVQQQTTIKIRTQQQQNYLRATEFRRCSMQQHINVVHTFNIGDLAPYYTDLKLRAILFQERGLSQIN